MKRTGMTTKIRECARSINYWNDHPDDPHATYSKGYFAKALRRHLAYIEETGEAINPTVMEYAKKALATV